MRAAGALSPHEPQRLASHADVHVGDRTCTWKLTRPDKHLTSTNVREVKDPPSMREWARWTSEPPAARAPAPVAWSITLHPSARVDVEPTCRCTPRLRGGRGAGRQARCERSPQHKRGAGSNVSPRAAAQPVRRPWRWPWPQRAQTLTTSLTAWRRAACRARRAHRVHAAWRGSVVLAKSGVKTTELDSAGMKKTTKRTRGAIWVAGGGVLRLWQGAGPTRITQGRSVGRLQPKVHSLGVAG